MKIFQNNRTFKKLIVVFLIIMLFSFVTPKVVNAGAKEIGGELLSPVMSFFVTISDGAMTLLQKVVYHMDESLINIDTSTSLIAKIIVGIATALIVAVSIVAVVATGGGAIAIAAGVVKIVITATVVTTITFPITTGIVEGMLPDSFYLPLFEITPQEIFSNKVPLLDVDFFNPTDSKVDTVSEKDEDGNWVKKDVESKSTAAELRSTVASWYIILRNIAVVSLLSILVYTGIRIILSSTASDKAKYKQMLVDWIVALCLLFVMQYIMSFSNMLVEKIIDVVDITQLQKDTDTEVTDPEMFAIKDKKFIKRAYETLISEPAKDGSIDSEENSPYYMYFVDDSGNKAGKNATVMYWPAENFMQQARINLQLLQDDEETYVAIGWKIIYVVLVLYTFIFVFTYLKRVVYMTFLTIIAPLVAMTYPLDKMNDGKAQAFDMWFKEYIFNLLIQPMHLILYTILISSAMDFASKNILYVLVALGFMVPAEKLLRRFFGFEKAHTPGLLAGPAGAAIMMNGMNKLMGRGSKGVPQKQIGGKNESKESGKNLRFNGDFNAEDVMLDEGNNINTSLNSPGGNNINTPLNGPGGNNINTPLNGPGESNTDIPLKDSEASNTNISLNDSEKGNTNASLNGSGVNTPLNGLGGNDINQSLNSLRNTSTPLNGANKPKSRVKRILGATLAAGKYYARGSANNAMRRISDRVKNYHPIRTVSKAVAGAAGAATLGAAGTLIGVTAGDPTKLAQYGLAGAMGGYKMVSGIPDRLHSVAPTGTSEVFNRALAGSDEEYNKVQQKEYAKEIARDENIRYKLEERYGSKEAKEILDKDNLNDYISAGVTDIDDIMAAHDLEKNGIQREDGSHETVSRNLAIATARYAKRVGSDTTKMKKKDKDDWKNTFSSEFGKNGKVQQNGLDADTESKNVLRRIDAFYENKN